MKLILWLFQEGLRGRLWHFFSVIYFSFLGIGTVAVSFGLLLGYARHKINGGLYQFRGYSIDIPQGVEGLLIVACGALFFGILSALCTYWAHNKILMLTSFFHRNAIVSAISVLDASYMRPGFENLKFLSPKHDQRHIATIYTNYLAISLKMLLESVQPFITLSVAVILLCYLNLKATLSLLPLTMIYLIVIYVIGKKSTTLQGDYLTRISTASPTLLEFYKALAQSSNPFYKTAFIEKVLQCQKIDKILSLFYGRILVSYQSAFASQLFLPVSMVWLFVVFGWALGEDKNSWTLIIVFLITLRFAGQSIKKCASLFVGVSRFYPSIRIYKEFIVETKKIHDASVLSNTESRIEEFLDIPSEELKTLLDIKKSICLKRGIPVFVLWFSPEKTTLLEGVVKRNISNIILSGNSFLKSSIYYHGTPKIVSILTFKDWALGTDYSEDDELRLEALLADFDVLHEFKAFSHGLNTECSAESINALSREVVFILSAGYLFLHPKEMIVIDLKGFYPLDKKFQQKFLKMSAGFFIVFFSNSLETPVKFTRRLDISVQSSTFMLATDEIIGFCDIDYIQKNWEGLANFQSSKEEESSVSQLDDSLDLDEQAIF